MAELHQRHGAFDEAARALEDALLRSQVAPQRVRLYLQLARVWLDGGSPARAIALLRRLSEAATAAEVPFDQRAEIALAHAAALAKRRWLGEAITVLRRSAHPALGRVMMAPRCRLKPQWVT